MNDDEDATLDDEVAPEPTVEEEIVAASEEDKAIVAEGAGKTTIEIRTEIRRLVAEGEMTPSQCAAKFGISVQYVSKLLKQKGIRFGSAKQEREARAKAEKEEAERKAKATFAERKAIYAEEHRMGIYQQLRSGLVLEAIRQKGWREAAMHPTSPSLPPPKEAMISARTMALIDQRIRILLDLDNQVDEEALPSIEITYMGDEEIAAMQRGPSNEDLLAPLDNDVIEEVE